MPFLMTTYSTKARLFYFAIKFYHKIASMGRTALTGGRPYFAYRPLWGKAYQQLNALLPRKVRSSATFEVAYKFFVASGLLASGGTYGENLLWTKTSVARLNIFFTGIF